LADPFEDMPQGAFPGRGFFGEFSKDGKSTFLPLSDAPALHQATQWGTTCLTQDEQGWLAFYGTLHNRRELAAGLGLASDTPLERLLLSVRARWPGRWRQHLDGVWVLAHGDPQHHVLALHRDPSGALGLFYARTAAGALVFATHLDSLASRLGTRPRLALRGLQEYLRLLDIAAPNSIYDQVHAVPPGEGVAWGADGPEEALASAVFPTRALSLQAAADELERCLDQAIRRRLEGVARPAAFLSGGVDSALICALAARQRPDLTAITVGFEGAQYDEAPIAHAIARHLGIRHEVLRFGRDELVQALALAGHHAEQPMADPALPVSLLAFDWARQRHDAVLDGSGADELVGAMPPRHMRVAVEWAARIPAGLRRRIARAMGHLPKLADYRPIFDFEHPAEPLMRWHGFRREEIEALTGATMSLDHTRFHQVFRRFPPAAHYERYSALLEAMPCERLTQAILITGLDVRFPYWDPEVEALLRGLPLDLRWRPDCPKHVLRTLLARHVPQKLWDVPKHGFNFPLHEFLTAEDFRLVRRYLLEADWKGWQVLSPEGVAGYARRFMAGEPGLTFRVWALVVLAAWLEGHGH
jgi:asparagine synthase (glutamine-hydrolysing)